MLGLGRIAGLMGMGICVVRWKRVHLGLTCENGKCLGRDFMLWVGEVRLDGFGDLQHVVFGGVVGENRFDMRIEVFRCVSRCKHATCLLGLRIAPLGSINPRLDTDYAAVPGFAGLSCWSLVVLTDVCGVGKVIYCDT